MIARLRNVRHWVAAASAIGALLVSATAHAGDPFYLGTWKLIGAGVAPWADPARRPDAKEAARLRGKTLTFKAREIAGPLPFPCKRPKYRVIEYSADMLFQGALGEMQAKDGSVDPTKLAASL